MATVKKTRQKVDTILAGGLHTKFKRKVKRNKTTMAEVLRKAARKYVKPN